MKTKLVTSRATEVLGLLMIGEGVVGAIWPRRYSSFWNIGPRWLRKAAIFFANSPATTRLICAAETATGLWMAARQLDKR
jgi:hypothetical protein